MAHTKFPVLIYHAQFERPPLPHSLTCDYRFTKKGFYVCAFLPKDASMTRFLSLSGLPSRV